MRMLERPCASGKAYNVCGESDVTFWGMFEAYREAGGKVPRLVLPFPLPLRFAYSLDRAKRELDFENRDLVAGFTDMLHLS